MTRPYTGDSRPVARKETPHLRALVNNLCMMFPALWDNGTWGIRPKRGKTEMSVHAKGTAADLSYRYMKVKGVRFGARRNAVKAMDFLVANADDLGLEMIIDYGYKPHGRGWRCDRNSWVVYDKPTVEMGGVGDWIHVEVDGKKKPLQVNMVFMENGH